jgi:glyoxylase-like metal-dependent hydrolase (beta-lactamase superfamily II)
MAVEIVPGIYQLKIPIDSPLEFVNGYLVQGDRGWSLIDTGWNVPQIFQALCAQLQELGLGLEDISQIVVTHIHPDHYGLAGKLKQLCGAQVAFHRVEQELVGSRYADIDGLLEEMASWLHFNGAPEDVLESVQTASVFMKEFVVPVPPDRALEDGENLSIGRFNFRVIWTPGHSPGHICLYEPEKKILLSGDHILPTITPNVSLHTHSGLNPLHDYLYSLGLIEQLEVELVLPAHEFAFTELRSRIAEIVQHHRERKALMLEIIGDEPKTAYQIATRVPWNTNDVSWEELPSLERRIAVTETLAHLEFLRGEKQVERFLSQGIAFYRSQ